MNYYLWQNETQTGPFTENQLKTMWSGGQLTINSLYWQEGMPEWSTLADLQQLLDATPAAPPSTVPPPLPPADAIPCPYCSESITMTATRCKHCGGELLPCPTCKRNVAVETKRKFVGIARGGTQDVKKCRNCGKQLAGPRW
jgi:hypothetical protein